MVGQLRHFAGIILVGSVLAALGHGLPILPASATKCWRPSPGEHIAHSDMVFFGEVLRTPPRQHSRSARIATLKVLRNYKGADVPLIRLLDMADRIYGWTLNAGDTLLVFASKLNAGSGRIDADARISYCLMVPYHGRKFLHPKYWDKLSRGLN